MPSPFIHHPSRIVYNSPLLWFLCFAPVRTQPFLCDQAGKRPSSSGNKIYACAGKKLYSGYDPGNENGLQKTKGNPYSLKIMLTSLRTKKVFMDAIRKEFM
jgi:hypothetical protein